MPTPGKLHDDLLRIMKRSASSVDLEGFLAEMLDVFEGPRSLAMEFKKVYDASSGSPMVRQKILQMIQSLIHAVTVHQNTRQLDPSALSDADLEELTMAYLGRAHAAEEAQALPAPGPGPDDDAGEHAGGG